MNDDGYQGAVSFPDDNVVRVDDSRSNGHNAGYGRKRDYEFDRVYTPFASQVSSFYER